MFIVRLGASVGLIYIADGCRNREYHLYLIEIISWYQGNTKNRPVKVWYMSVSVSLSNVWCLSFNYILLHWIMSWCSCTAALPGFGPTSTTSTTSTTSILLYHLTEIFQLQTLAFPRMLSWVEFIIARERNGMLRYQTDDWRLRVCFLLNI